LASLTVSSHRYHVPAPAALVIGQLPPVSVATLINGKGRYKGGPSVALSVIKVTKDKKCRFRLIGMSCDPDFTFSMDNYLMTVIEADGEYTLPHDVDSLRVFAGQRYSVVVVANQNVDNYWVRANPNRGDSGFDGAINTTIFQYEGAPDTDPSTDPATAPICKRPLNEIDLHALFSPEAPGLPFAGGADVVLNIAHNFDFATFHYVMNHPAYRPSSPPDSQWGSDRARPLTERKRICVAS
jgi:iron transport multicopper oxidase